MVMSSICMMDKAIRGVSLYIGSPRCQHFTTSQLETSMNDVNLSTSKIQILPNLKRTP